MSPPNLLTASDFRFQPIRPGQLSLDGMGRIGTPSGQSPGGPSGDRQASGSSDGAARRGPSHPMTWGLCNSAFQFRTLGEPAGRNAMPSDGVHSLTHPAKERASLCVSATADAIRPYQ